MARNSKRTRKTLTAGQKAARTKGRSGLASAAAKAAATKLLRAVKGTRGETRAALLARIEAHQSAAA